MKAINYILGFGGFAAAVVAAIYIGRFAAFAWRCHDIPLAMSCTLGVIWFGALAVKYCSMQCGGMARRKRNQEKREARAKELGITVEELKRRIKRGCEARSRYGNGRIVYGLKRPKTYKEICAANRRHPIAAGWRGQPVMGGGAGVRHNDPWLKPSEYARCPGVTSEIERARAASCRKSKTSGR